MSKGKILSIVKCCSAVLILIMDLLAIFLPYSMEVFFGIALIGLCGYAVSSVLTFRETKLWESVSSLLLSVAVCVLTIVFLFGKFLNLYYPIEIVEVQ